MNYKDVYERWLNSAVVDDTTKAELMTIANDEKEIEERFYRELEFPLKTIAKILSSPDYDKSKAIRKQKELTGRFRSFF